MNKKIFAVTLLALAVVLVSGWFVVHSKESAGSAPGASIPTFSTGEIGRKGHFYVGGHYVGSPATKRCKAPCMSKRGYQRTSGILIPLCSSPGAWGRESMN